MAAIEEEIRRDEALIRQVEYAAQESDFAAFLAGLNAGKDDPELLRPMVQSLARLRCPPSANFRRRLELTMDEHGASISAEVGDDLVLALRALFPPYRGTKSLPLYRGQAERDHQRRAYGIFWTRDRAIAEAFATGMHQSSAGGSVLLKSEVPPSAIIHVPRFRYRAYEKEVWVDKTRLGDVRVIARFSESSGGR